MPPICSPPGDQTCDSLVHRVTLNQLTTLARAQPVLFIEQISFLPSDNQISVVMEDMVGMGQTLPPMLGHWH